MVSRDAFTHRAYPVSALSVSTPEESALNAMGEGEPNVSPSLLSHNDHPWCSLP